MSAATLQSHNDSHPSHWTTNIKSWNHRAASLQSTETCCRLQLLIQDQTFTDLSEVFRNYHPNIVFSVSAGPGVVEQNMWLYDELTSNEVRLSGEDQLHFTFIPNNNTSARLCSSTLSLLYSLLKLVYIVILLTFVVIMQPYSKFLLWVCRTIKHETTVTDTLH